MAAHLYGLCHLDLLNLALAGVQGFAGAANVVSLGVSARADVNLGIFLDLGRCAATQQCECQQG